MKSPIRVLHVLGSLDCGGAETMVMNIYRSIDRSRIQFDFITHTSAKGFYEDEITKLGGKIYRVSRYTGKNHFIYKKTWNEFFLNHQEHSIVHGHVRSTAAIYLKIAKKYDKVTIAHSHSTASRGNAIESVVKYFMQLPIRYTSDYFFACSDDSGKWLFGEKVTKRNNYKIIKNAIDFEKFIYNEKTRNKIKKNLNIEDKFVLGHVGSFTQPKNHKFLLEVYREVLKRKANAVLLLVGDGELRSQIENQLVTFEIHDRVTFTGVVSNVNEYMQAMDVFVFPSIFEGFGIVLIEAQATGLPCVVSDTIPRETHISDLLVQLSIEQTPKYWADVICKHTANRERKDMYREIKCTGYDIKMMVNVLEEFYSKICMQIY